MADISRAFENLNRSLRYISDSRRLKQQATQQHQEKMLRLETEINDPRRKLLQDQAREQLRPVKASSPIPMSTSNASSRYNQETTTGLNKIFSEHNLSVDPDNPQRVIDLTTGQAGMKPKHIMEGLQQDVDTYMTVRKLGYTQKQHLSELNQQISDLDKKVGSKAKDKFSQHNYGELVDERNTLEKDLVDPTKQRQNLNSRMQLLRKAMDKAVLSKNGGLSKLIDGMLDRTQKNLLSLGDKGITKGQRAHKYTTRDGMRSVTEYHVPGTAPGLVQYGPDTLYPGTRRLPTKGSGSDKSPLIEKARRLVFTKKYSNLELRFAGIDLDEEKRNKLMARVGKGMTQEARDTLMDFWVTANKESMKIIQNEMDAMDSELESYKWWRDFRKTDKDNLHTESYKETNKLLRKTGSDNLELKSPYR